MAFPGRWWHEPNAQDAFWMSWVSLLFTVIAAFGGLIGFKKTDSTLILAFGLENLVDFTSSVIVLWRFYCPHGCDDEAQMTKLKKREERASVAISMIIGILGLFVLGVAIYDFTQNDDEQNLALLFVISFVSIVIFGVLTVIKFKYARVLDSPSLYKDGICSLIGTSLSASLLLTTAIIEEVPQAGYIDPVVSLIVGLTAIVYGFKVIVGLVMDGVPIFHPGWWVEKKEIDEEGTDSAEYQQSEKDTEIPQRTSQVDEKDEDTEPSNVKDIERQLV
eukprot:CCRYP_015366-RA/>CCRYP_015366-RA protein AED:0.33 eAED:0.33 QI:222/1/0.8/1/0.5/0.4/5/1668/275